MKQILFILLFPVILSPLSLHAQLEKVIVETYYISDANDATDTLGGYLEAGSTTYRIYIDLKAGYKLMKLYGDSIHPLKISSTANFFNNAQDGVSFAKDMTKSRLSEGTVALDTWLTLGQVTAKKSGITNFGVLKTEDRNGSFIGGVNNDGGSAAIATGLLVNADSSSGIPLTTADGYDTMNTVPTAWLDNGFKDIATGADSTIFGSIIQASQFISNSAFIQSSGVMGVNPDSNQVLVAQLTTKGQISFELNIWVLNTKDTLDTIRYVASKSVRLLPNETLAPSLKYPPECGCRDPNFLEYNASFGCDNTDSCKTRIVFGCMDTLACNYDPKANFSVPSLCCYPGFCNDRDIRVVCPGLTSAKRKLDLYPNPVQNQLTMQASSDGNNIEAKYVIYNCFGRVVMERNLGIISGITNQPVDVGNLGTGLYLFRLFIGDISESIVFMKN